MTSEKMAHQLLLKPAFQMTEAMAKGCINATAYQIRIMFQKAFWSSLEDDLQLSQPCYTRVLKVLGEMRDRITSLSGEPASSMVQELVDIDLIRQQIKVNVLNWTACARLVNKIFDIIKKVQIRLCDAETDTMWIEKKAAMDNAEVAEQPAVFCKALQFLAGRVNLMFVDAANVRLCLIETIIRDH
jgi:hypothetical protein